MNYIYLIGRILFSLVFLIKGFDHFSDGMIRHAADMGAPNAAFFVPLWGLLAVIGGLSILLGYKMKAGATLLVIFLVPTTFLMHPFWSGSNSFETMMQGYCFWKNIALIGALCMIYYHKPGPCCVNKIK